MRISEEKKRDLSIAATTFIGAVVFAFLPPPYWFLSPICLGITIIVLLMVLIIED
ncbi:MAG: hypothetical protein ACFE9L_20965 [Candidatus Hodarchaeota archaeon]